MTKKLQKFNTKVSLFSKNLVSLDEILDRIISVNATKSRNFELDAFIAYRDDKGNYYTEAFIDASYTAKGANLTDIRRLNEKYFSQFSEFEYAGNSTKVL